MGSQDFRLTVSRRSLLAGMGGALGLAGMGFSPSAAFAQGSTLRAAITGFGVINTLDPSKASLIAEFYVIWGIFNGLLKFDENMNIVPDLAESYELREDGSMTFKLRSGVKVHGFTQKPYSNYGDQFAKLTIV